MGRDAFGEVLPVECVLGQGQQPQESLGDCDISQAKHFGSPGELVGENRFKSPEL